MMFRSMSNLRILTRNGVSANTEFVKPDSQTFYGIPVAERPDSRYLGDE